MALIFYKEIIKPFFLDCNVFLHKFQRNMKSHYFASKKEGIFVSFFQGQGLAFFGRFAIMFFGNYVNTPDGYGTGELPGNRIRQGCMAPPVQRDNRHRKGRAE